MNSDVMKGSINDFGGKTKEEIGRTTGDRQMEASGVTDQITGSARKAYGTARDAVAPAARKARSFAKARPYSTAAAIGVAGLAILNTLRGR